MPSAHCPDGASASWGAHREQRPGLALRQRPAPGDDDREGDRRSHPMGGFEPNDVATRAKLHLT